MQNGFAVSSGIWWALAATCLLLPLLIHLIQLYRHKKIRWAAMAFLLKSQKRSQRWVRIKQWLLIATRMAVLLLGLFTLGQFGCNDRQFQQFFGDDAVTHHLILIDDSFSMDQVLEGSSPAARSFLAIEQLLKQLAKRPNQRLTLSTWSTSTALAEANQDLSDELRNQAKGRPSKSLLLVDDQILTSQLAQQVSALLAKRPKTFTADGPESPIAWAMERTAVDPSQRYVIHVLSDFRGQQWGPTAGVWRRLGEAAANQIRLNLIDCGWQKVEGNPASQNLAVQNLVVEGSLNTTRVPQVMQVAIKNFGSQVANNVVVSLTAYESLSDQPLLKESELPLDLGTPEHVWRKVDLPAVLIESIAPGETTLESFPVAFPTAGRHLVAARLPEDFLAADNQRHQIVEVKANVSVLVIDNTLGQDRRYLTQALNPGNTTGIVAEVQTASAIRQWKADQLDQFPIIYMVNVPRLDAGEVDKLVRYVQAGGGLVWFVGDNVQTRFYNQTLVQKGLFPLVLQRVVDSVEAVVDEPADLQTVSHPIFDAFGDDDGSQLDAVVFSKLWKVDAESLQSGGGTGPIQSMEVLANFRGKSTWPLVTQHRLGAGKIVTFLTAIDGQWNNWPQELTFPSGMLLLSEFLAARSNAQTLVVGGDLRVDLPAIDVKGVKFWLRPLRDQTIEGLQVNVMAVDASVVSGQSPQGEGGAAIDALPGSAGVGNVSAIGDGPSVLVNAWAKQAMLRRIQMQWATSDSESRDVGSDVAASASDRGPLGEGIGLGEMNWQGSGMTVGLTAVGPTVVDVGFEKATGSWQYDRVVTHVAVEEGDLSRSDMNGLSGLPADQVQFLQWNQIDLQMGQVATTPLTRILFAVLLALLAVEPILAIWTAGQ